MTDTSSMKLGMERCLTCDHRWIDYEGIRKSCYLCGGTNISECVSLRDIRDAINNLRKGDTKYLDKHAKRSVILKQRYREIAELALQRAQEIYGKIKSQYTKGNLSDKVIDQLIIAFRLFSELGVHKSGAACAYMAAMGYAQRGIEKEIRTVEDLGDLVASRQWFMRLGLKEWEAAVNIRIGERAMAAIGTDANVLQIMMQVSLWHYYQARNYYFENRDNKMVDRLQFDIERAIQMLSSYTQGLSHIEAAKIAAQSNVKYGEEIRQGLESLGHSVGYGLTALGEHIENCGGSLSRALQASSAVLSANVTHAMYSLTPAVYRGRSLDKRMSEVGQLISSTARAVPDDFFKPAKELGAKFALGTGGAGKSNDVTAEPSVINLAESVDADIQKSKESLKHLDEPTIKLTGTLLDTLISIGIDKVKEQLANSSSPEKDHKF